MCKLGYRYMKPPTNWISVVDDLQWQLSNHLLDKGPLSDICLPMA